MPLQCIKNAVGGRAMPRPSVELMCSPSPLAEMRGLTFERKRRRKSRRKGRIVRESKRKGRGRRRGGRGLSPPSIVDNF